MTDNSFLSVYYEDQNYHKFNAVSELSTALLKNGNKLNFQ